jgi:hypothetical protein
VDEMKAHFTLTLAILSLPICGISQNWTAVNDSLIYFYQSSNDSNYFTSRTNDTLYEGGGGEFYFVDNFIPCDDCIPSGSEKIFRHRDGSVFGEKMYNSGDTTWFNSTIQFINNQALTSTSPFNLTEGSNITFDSEADSVIFGITDSVRYYSIDDGTQLIQSKSFGIIHWPKQNTDSIVHYKLVGIKDLAGKEFDYHNEVFDFEIGDRFFYEDGRSWEEFGTYAYRTYLYKLEIMDKYMIDGRWYYYAEASGNGYETHTYGGWTIPISHSWSGQYPKLGEDYDFSTYHFPGEQVRFQYTWDLGEPHFDEFTDFWTLPYHILGSDLTEFSGKTVLSVGNLGVDDLDYSSIGTIGGYGFTLNYAEIFGSPNLVENPIDSWDNTMFWSFEEGLGRNHLLYDLFENPAWNHLIGYIKGADTVGVYDVGIEAEYAKQLRIYPNPATDKLYLSKPFDDVKIYALNGELVLQIRKEAVIEIVTIPNGIYVLHATDENGLPYQTKFIKQ